MTFLERKIYQRFFRATITATVITAATITLLFFAKKKNRMDSEPSLGAYLIAGAVFVCCCVPVIVVAIVMIAFGISCLASGDYQSICSSDNMTGPILLLLFGVALGALCIICIYICCRKKTEIIQIVQG